jgi:hypothetical protein
MRSRKNIVAIPPRSLKPPAAATAVGFHLTIVDKSQLIEADLIRRKIVKKSTGPIRRKFSIDAELWRRWCYFVRPPIRNHNGAPAETRRSPSPRAMGAKSAPRRGVLSCSARP